MCGKDRTAQIEQLANVQYIVPTFTWHRTHTLVKAGIVVDRNAVRMAYSKKKFNAARTRFFPPRVRSRAVTRSDLSVHGLLATSAAAGVPLYLSSFLRTATLAHRNGKASTTVPLRVAWLIGQWWRVCNLSTLRRVF